MEGSPGIGKSWSLLYAPYRARLFEGVNVCLFVSKDNIMFYLSAQETKCARGREASHKKTQASYPSFQ